VKRVLFMVRTAPYGSAAIPESVRACLGFATMPIETTYLLMDDAAWALAPGQSPETIAAAPVQKLIANLADLDVRLCVEADALAERGLSAEGLPFEVEPLSQEAIAELIATADAVMTY
jgi:tRNA 2-thiouridine synthesizing protein C